MKYQDVLTTQSVSKEWTKSRYKEASLLNKIHNNTEQNTLMCLKKVAGSLFGIDNECMLKYTCVLYTYIFTFHETFQLSLGMCFTFLL